MKIIPISSSSISYLYKPVSAVLEVLGKKSFYYYENTVPIKISENCYTVLFIDRFNSQSNSGLMD